MLSGMLRRVWGALPKRQQDAIRASEAKRQRVERLVGVVFKDLPESSWRDVQFFDRLYKFHGPLRSSAGLDSQTKMDAELHFHFREKAEVALTAASSWYGGDYFEFGSGDLNTFRNMLTAYDICGMTQAYTDVRFYAFDIFGKLDAGLSGDNKGPVIDQSLENYFAPYTCHGDQIDVHRGYLAQHNLFTSKCILVQGLFENTLTSDFKQKYLAEGRSIGFAFLDCNIGTSYKVVFEYIFTMLAGNSYIYMDEYFQNPAVAEYFDQFIAELRDKRNIGCLYVRNAGGFGGLFRLYPLHTAGAPLELRLH
jgi:hypothetical protein